MTTERLNLFFDLFAEYGYCSVETVNFAQGCYGTTEESADALAHYFAGLSASSLLEEMEAAND